MKGGLEGRGRRQRKQQKITWRGRRAVSKSDVLLCTLCTNSSMYFFSATQSFHLDEAGIYVKNLFFFLIL